MRRRAVPPAAFGLQHATATRFGLPAIRPDNRSDEERRPDVGPTLVTMPGKSRESKNPGYRETIGRSPDGTEDRNAFFGLTLPDHPTNPAETEIRSGNLAEGVLPSRSR